MDALCCAHLSQLGYAAGAGQLQRNGALGSVTGYPSIVVPAGFSGANTDAPVGVPVGVELIGRPFDEGRLIEIAYGFEQASRLRQPPFMPYNPSAAVLDSLLSPLCP